jgi:hypothetical protein
MFKDRVQWHPAFATALKLELRDYYPGVLEFIEEYQLTSKPLEMDILIIKKVKDVKILKPLAEVFEGHNVIEYKSPNDYLSIDDYFKVKAYAYLYKALSEGENEIDIDDITITMVSNRFPRKMLNYIKEKQSIKFNRYDDGIYYLTGVDLKTQIIVIDELPKKVNRFIRLLSRRLDIRDDIKDLMKDYSINNKNSNYEMLFETVLTTNMVQFMEVCDMTKTLSQKEIEAINRVINKLNLAEKIKEEGKEEGKKEFLVRVLSIRFGKLPVSVKKKIEKITSTDLIEKIIDNIFEIDNLNEIDEYI